ncbi:hypothetical protein JHK82_039728 [Glycine max]|nr:hypothetical protein JHK86_039922 [Glycine max]KAG4965528.1 hypothetical protein JHK85_040503 [Glycine max]KAG5110505.1 hypothetical protein JHK82_039728 [Glycine max]KAG5121796.1 hypothetical protein JHK84_040136 [Glycine max]
MSYEDANWNGKLLETYDCGIDYFKISPCRWTLRQNHIASSLLNYSDSEILSICSTSPTAEAPDFVENLKRDRPFVNKEWQFISRSGSLSTRTLESRNQGRYSNNN